MHLSQILSYNNSNLHLDRELSQKDCNVIVSKFFKVLSIKQVSFNCHLKQLAIARDMGIVYRGKDKVWLVADIANELVLKKRITVVDIVVEI